MKHWIHLFSEVEQGKIKEAIFNFRPDRGVIVQVTTHQEIIAKMAHLLDGGNLDNLDERYNATIAPFAQEELYFDN